MKYNLKLLIQLLSIYELVRNNFFIKFDHSFSCIPFCANKNRSHECTLSIREWGQGSNLIKVNDLHQHRIGCLKEQIDVLYEVLRKKHISRKIMYRTLNASCTLDTKDSKWIHDSIIYANKLNETKYYNSTC